MLLLTMPSGHALATESPAGKFGISMAPNNSKSRNVEGNDVLMLRACCHPKRSGKPEEHQMFNATSAVDPHDQFTRI